MVWYLLQLANLKIRCVVLMMPRFCNKNKLLETIPYDQATCLKVAYILHSSHIKFEHLGTNVNVDDYWLDIVRDDLVPYMG